MKRSQLSKKRAILTYSLTALNAVQMKENMHLSPTFSEVIYGKGKLATDVNDN